MKTRNYILCNAYTSKYEALSHNAIVPLNSRTDTSSMLNIMFGKHYNLETESKNASISAVCGLPHTTNQKAIEQNTVCA